MLQTVSRRALCAAAALSFAAGCSGNTLTSGGSSALTPSTHVAGQAGRILPGPVVSGPILIPLGHPITNAPKGWPDKKKKKAILFVADCDSGVLMYDPTKANSSPVGSITTGTDCAFGAAVDKAGNLYVANISNNTVTVYPKGQTSPSLTISSAVSSPYSVAVDSKGNVFVSNLGNNTITAYAAGQTTAYETIAFNTYGQAVGIGTDGNDNLWVACDSTNGVFEIKAGSSGVTNSGITGLAGPIGVAFGPKDVLYVSNFSGNDVTAYDYGQTSPFETITSGMSGPTQNGVTAKGAFFQANQDLNVVGFKKGQTTLFSTLMGASSAAQIASSPLVKK
jgi:sugar lactone lactonase YvrE